MLSYENNQNQAIENEAFNLHEFIKDYNISLIFGKFYLKNSRNNYYFKYRVPFMEIRQSFNLT